MFAFKQTGPAVACWPQGVSFAFSSKWQFCPGKGPFLSTGTICLQTFFTPLGKLGLPEPRHRPGFCGGVKGKTTTQFKLWAKQGEGEKRCSPTLLGHQRRQVLCSWLEVVAGVLWPWASLWKWRLPCEKQHAGVWEGGPHWGPCPEPQSLRASPLFLITRRSWLGCQGGWLRLQEFFALLASPAKERKLPCIWHPSGGHGDWRDAIILSQSCRCVCFLRWLCILWKLKIPT